MPPEADRPPYLLLVCLEHFTFSMLSYIHISSFLRKYRHYVTLGFIRDCLFRVCPLSVVVAAPPAECLPMRVDELSAENTRYSLLSFIAVKSLQTDRNRRLCNHTQPGAVVGIRRPAAGRDIFSAAGRAGPADSASPCQLATKPFRRKRERAGARRASGRCASMKSAIFILFAGITRFRC